MFLVGHQRLVVLNGLTAANKNGIDETLVKRAQNGFLARLIFSPNHGNALAVAALAEMLYQFFKTRNGFHSYLFTCLFVISI